MDELITLDVIAKELRVTRRTIQTLASTGKLPAITAAGVVTSASSINKCKGGKTHKE